MPLNLKHKESGVGLFFAGLQWFVFVKMWLRLTAYVWPKLIQLKTDCDVSDMNFLIIVGVATTAITLTIGNTFFGLLYYFKIPFFEKYKSLDEPWPWESDPSSW